MKTNSLIVAVLLAIWMLTIRSSYVYMWYNLTMSTTRPCFLNPLRHPVQYCHSEGRLLVIGHVPYVKFLHDDDVDGNIASLRWVSEEVMTSVWFYLCWFSYDFFI